MREILNNRFGFEEGLPEDLEFAISLVEKADKMIGFKGISLKFIFEHTNPPHTMFFVDKAFAEREQFIRHLYPSARVDLPKIFSAREIVFVAQTYYDIVRRL
jgi:hypothetical protein